MLIRWSTRQTYCTQTCRIEHLTVQVFLRVCFYALLSTAILLMQLSITQGLYTIIVKLAECKSPARDLNTELDNEGGVMVLAAPPTLGSRHDKDWLLL